VKTVSDLSRLRRALARGVCIKSSAIAADDLDFRMLLEPVSRGPGRAIRQQFHHLATLQVDDDRPESHTFPPSPFIDAGDTDNGTVGRRSRALLYAAQDRGVTHWHAKPGQQSLGGSATYAVAKQLDDPGQPGGPACKWDCKRRKPLGENPALAVIVPTSPAGQPRLDVHRPPLSRKIAQRPYIGAVTGTRFYATERTAGAVAVLFGVTTVDRDDPVQLPSLDGDDGQIWRRRPRR
jgi:hypothetical protein